MILGFIVWLLVGAFVGWIASVLMKTDGQQGMILNIVVGIIGAALGGFLFRLFGASGANINDSGLTVYTFLVSLAGAVVLLGLVRLVRRA